MPDLFPAELKMVPDQEALLATLDDADGVICESLTIGAAELAERQR